MSDKEIYHINKKLLTPFQTTLVNAISSSFYMFGFGLLVSLLVLYLITSKGESKVQAYQLFSVFLSLYFCLSMAGGVLGQHNGYRNAASVGVIGMVVGLLVLSFFNHLSIGLGIFVVGSGFFVPNKSVCLGQIFKKEDKGRDSAFTFSYFLMNFGALLGAGLSGTITKHFEYKGAFLIAATSMFIAGISFLLFYSKYPFLSSSQCYQQNQSQFSFRKIKANSLSAILLSVLAVALISYPYYDDVLIIGTGFGIAFYLLGLSFFSGKFSNQEKKNLQKFLRLIILLTLFWSFCDLGPTALLIFVKDHVDRVIFHYQVPVSDFYSLDPASVFIVGLLVYFLFKKRLIEKLKTSSKLLIGLVLASIALIILFVGSNVAQNQPVSIVWVVMIYLFIALGEILVGPTGKAMVGELAPPGQHGLLMGFSQFVNGFSAIISGFFAMGTVNKGYHIFGYQVLGLHYLAYALTILLILIVLIIFSKPFQNTKLKK